MQVIARSTLGRFWTQHPEARISLERWLRIVKAASWTSMLDIQETFPKAKILNRERARFEVHGGDYRLVVSFDMRDGRKLAFIKFVGTHAAYDAIDALTHSDF